MLKTMIEGYMDDFISEKILTKCSKNTILSYKQTFDHFLAYIDTQSDFADINDLNLLQKSFFVSFLAYFAELGDNRMKDYKNSTINAHLTRIQALLRNIEESTEVKQKNIKRLESLKIEDERTKKEGLTKEELQAIFELLQKRIDQHSKRHILNLRNLLLFKMLYFAPLRISDFAKLTFQDLQIEDDKLYVIKSKIAKTKRVIELFVPRAEIERIIEELYSNGVTINTPLVFRADFSIMTRQELYLLFTRVIEAAGVRKKRGTHIMRHTRATHLINDAVPIQVASATLGHSSITTTERSYARVTRDSLKDCYR